MEYKNKYLKYQKKYQNLVKINGGADADLDEDMIRALEESRLHYQLQESDLQRAIRESELEENKRKSELENEFYRRVRNARILVIGASFDNQSDFDRWSQVDPNFLGVSHMSEDPIGQLGNWNENH